MGGGGFSMEPAGGKVAEVSLPARYLGAGRA